MSKYCELKPLESMAKAMQRRARSGRALPHINWQTSTCMRCGVKRPFPGGSLPMQLRYTGLRGVLGGPPYPLKIILHEQPTSGALTSWNHCGTISVKKSKESGSPQHDWASLCPACSPTKGVADDLELVRKQLLEDPKLRLVSTKPDRCRSCKVATREGLDFDCWARFEGKDGKSMAIISIVEMDPSGFDFRPGFQADADHWWFSGVLDTSRGDRSSNYHWSITCPTCVRKTRQGKAEAPTIPKNAIL